MIFLTLQFFLKNKENNCFIVDSFPVKAYENHKSFQAKIFSSKEFHDLNLNFSMGDLILGDKAYTDYSFKDLLAIEA